MSFLNAEEREREQCHVVSKEIVYSFSVQSRSLAPFKPIVNVRGIRR
jgi:hypothetical protein